MREVTPGGAGRRDGNVIGQVEAIFRYPVKSMAGERIEAAELGWHGISGDRRLSVQRTGDRSGFPWLTASKMRELVVWQPLHKDDEGQEGLPTHVRTPEGAELEIFGEELTAEIARRHGAPVHVTHLQAGIFDAASVSVITSATAEEIGRASGSTADARRFRPNILLRPLNGRPFQEDDWVGEVLSFGDETNGPRISVTQRDPRCSMINIDPDNGTSDPEVLKAVVRLNGNHAGIYATVVRTGRLAVGQVVRFQAATDE